MEYFYKNQKIATPLTIKDTRKQYINESLNLKREVVTLSGQRFDLSFSLEPSHNPAAVMLSMTADFDKVETMVFPQPSGVEDDRTYSGTLNVQVAAGAGSDTVTVRSQSGHGSNKKIPAGYFIKFSGHSKVYLVTQELILNNTTNKTLNIYPRLSKEVPVNNKVLMGGDVIYTYKKDVGTQRGMSFVNGAISNAGLVSLIENI